MIKLSQSGKADCIVISLDRETTFDLVEWPYLFFTLEILGLGEVLGEVELPKHSILHLFAIASEPLAKAIRCTPVVCLRCAAVSY